MEGIKLLKPYEHEKLKHNFFYCLKFVLHFMSRTQQKFTSHTYAHSKNVQLATAPVTCWRSHNHSYSQKAHQKKYKTQLSLNINLLFIAGSSNLAIPPGFQLSLWLMVCLCTCLWVCRCSRKTNLFPKFNLVACVHVDAYVCSDFSNKLQIFS